MRPRERPAARDPIGGKSVRKQRVEVDRDLPVPKLAHVEIPAGAVLLGTYPAEEDVARRLHEPLALNHALAVTRDGAGAEERLEHRRLRLLHLQKERVVLV